LQAEVLAAVYGARTQHCPIFVAPTDAAEGSRLGGRAPDALAQAPVRCPRCGGAMEYDLTLSGPDLGAAFEVSHFHCRDFDCLLRGGRALRALADPPSTLALAHPASRRSDVDAPHDSGIEARGLIVGPPRSDQARGGPPEESKIGGQPGLIQAGEGLEQKLEAAGLGFLFQLSELDYPKGLKVDTYRYGGGSFYVYATFEPGGAPGAARIASFWQSS